MKTKKCILCNKEFIPKSYNQQVCMGQHIFTCPICNKEYVANRTQIKQYIKNNRMNCCSIKCSNEQIKRTKLDKYGDSNYNNINKAKKTKLDKYGDSNYNNINKVKKTKLDKYGDSNFNNINKAKKTKLDKYGDSNYNNRPKFTQTCIDRYGTKTPLENEKICNKMIHTMNTRYGANSPTMIPTIKNKVQKSNINKYSVKNYTQLHYTKTAKNILFNKEKFIEFCKKYKDIMNYTLCADILGIQDTTFKKYYIKYGCDKLYPIKNIFTKEIEIENLLNRYNIEYEKHNRKVLYPKELDYYIPSKNLAIEFNGTYWHSQEKTNNKKYHYNKSKQCEEKGIRLIHIFEYEWENERQRPILENIIKNALGINDKKIYARKCKVTIKPSNEMREFFDTNNIQGFRGRKICNLFRI